jgi:hypothetical protein
VQNPGLWKDLQKGFEKLPAGLIADLSGIRDPSCPAPDVHQLSCDALRELASRAVGQLRKLGLMGDSSPIDAWIKLLKSNSNISSSVHSSEPNDRGEYHETVVQHPINIRRRSVALCSALAAQAAENEFRHGVEQGVGANSAHDVQEVFAPDNKPTELTPSPGPLTPRPVNIQARVSLSDELKIAEARTADPKLQKKLAAVVRYTHYLEGLKTLHAACKQYQTPALLEQRFRNLDVWMVMNDDDKADIAKGDFQPGIFAWALVKRMIGLHGRHDRTLKNYRKALRSAKLL